MSSWINSHGQYTAAAQNTFLQAADYFLVSHALAYECTVVTHEKAAISVHRVKIPSVCQGLGVGCVTPFEMLRHEKAKFVLGPGVR